MTDSVGVLDRWEVKARDMVGRATSVERQLRGRPTAQVRGFAYDGEGRVLPSEGKAVGWDPDGNRKQYGGPVAHGADGSLSAGTYDPAGNLTGSGCRTNTFDGFDRLKSTSGCGKPQVDYTYDGLDRQATVATAGSGSGSGTRKGRYVGTSDTGGGRVFTHFTDEAGATGITGTRPLAVSQSAEVGQLTFSKGNNPFLVGESGIGVTDLGLDATPGQLNGIGVFGPRQQYGIQFSELDAWNSGVRIMGDLPSRNIYSIPGGCTITGTYTFTRLR